MHPYLNEFCVGIPSGSGTKCSSLLGDDEFVGLSLYDMNWFHPVSPLRLNIGYANGS